MVILKTNNIKKSFGSLEVLKGISFEVEQGEIVAIVGASGSGKTTLLQIIGTLLQPSSGSVILKDKEITSLSEDELACARNQEIGFIFQFHNLLPEFTAIENVCMPALIGKKSEKETEERARYLLDLLNLNDRINHKPSELSGGEKQRVAAARALINNPSIILADEPSGSLDSTNQEEMYKLFYKLRKEFNQTFIIVTHDEKLAKAADRTIHIQDGKIIRNASK